MYLINLKDCYPEIYTEDQFILVSREVYKIYQRFEKDKKTHREILGVARKIFL